MSARDAIDYGEIDLPSRRARVKAAHWFDETLTLEDAAQEATNRATTIADLNVWREVRGTIASRTFVIHRLRPASYRSKLESKFRALKGQWMEDTMFMSSVADRVLHPGYQKIIGMGPDVVSILLKDLSSEDSDWFWALEHITEDNPVPSEEWGNRQQMIQRWLEWGKSKGYL